MEEYIVKKCGNSLHIILDKKLHKLGDRVKIVSEEDERSIGLLMGTVENLKTRVEVLESKI